MSLPAKTTLLQVLAAAGVLSSTSLMFARRRAAATKPSAATAVTAATAVETKAPVKSASTKRLFALLGKSRDVRKWTVLLASTLVGHLLIAMRVSEMISRMGSLLARLSPDLYETQVDFALLAIPHSLLLAGVTLVESRLALACRRALAEEIHAQVGAGAMLSNAHVASAQINEVSRSLGELATKTIKPVLETGLLFTALSRMMGARQLAAAMGFFAIAGSFSRALAPSLKASATVVNSAEQGYAQQVRHLEDFKEEIALVGAQAQESAGVTRRFNLLASALEGLSLETLAASSVDTYVVRYCGILACFAMMKPALQSGSHRVSILGAPGKGDGAEYFLTVLHLLVQMMSAGRDGFAALRLYGALKAQADQVLALVDGLEPPKKSPCIRQQQSGGGLVVRQLAVSTPDGQPLVVDLGFELRPGQGCLLLGGNGVGKTSILRVLRGLWAPASPAAVIIVPSSVCFLPRRPLLLRNGETVLDNLAYPSAEPVDRAEAERVLREVGLPDRLRLDDAVPADLSAGEEQRLACARALLRPCALVLADEATSACAAEFERDFFAKLKRRGTAFVAVTHRADVLMPLANVVVRVAGPTAAPAVSFIAS